MGLISAAGSVIGSLVGGLFGNKSQSDTNKANAEENEKNRQFNHNEAELAYQRQMAMMQYQNQYNSASAQRQRLEEAGLNPYLMLDGGSAGEASSASSTPATAPSPIPMQAQRYEWMTDMAMKAAQIKAINANANKDNAQAGLFGQQNAGQEIQNAYNQFNLDFDRQWRETIAKYDLNNKDADTLLKDSQRFQNQMYTFRIARMTPLEAANMASDTAKKDLESAGIKWNTEQSKALYPLLAAKYAADILKTKAEAWVTNQEGNFNNATFYGRRDAINYAAGLAKYNYKSAVMKYGIDKIKAGAFQDGKELWLNQYRYYLESHISNGWTWNNIGAKLDFMLNRVVGWLPGSTPGLNLDMQLFNNLSNF